MASMTLLIKICTHYVSVTILVVVFARAIENCLIPLVAPPETLKDFSPNAIIGLLALQIPILVFIFEKSSKVILIRKVFLNAFGLRKVFALTLIAIWANFLFVTNTLISLATLILLTFIDLGIFVIACNLVSRSNLYDSLVKEYLQKIVRRVSKKPGRYRTSSDSGRGIELVHSKHTFKLLDIMGDLDKGLNKHYGELSKSNDYAEILAWVSIIANSIDATMLDNRQDNHSKHTVTKRVNQDIRGETYHILSSSIVEIFERQLDNILKSPNHHCARLILDSVSTSLDQQFPLILKDINCNPIDVTLSTDVVDRDIRILREFFRQFLIYHHNKEISSDHLTVFQEFLSLFEVYGQRILNELEVALPKNKDDCYTLKNVFIEQYLGTIQYLAVSGLSDNQYIYNRVGESLNRFKEHIHKSAIDAKPAGNPVDCSLLMFYFYTKYKKYIWDTSTLGKQKTLHKNDRIAKFIASWNLKHLTQTVILCNNQRFTYDSCLPSLLKDYEKEKHDSSMKLLWMSLVLDKSKEVDTNPTSYADGSLLSCTTFFQDFGEAYKLLEKTVDKRKTLQKQNIKKLVRLLKHSDSAM